ncbi:MAG: hypothetical protein RL538_633 [Candidatus Parcubacteria bacterium]|jgi:hypothetical protein
MRHHFFGGMFVGAILGSLVIATITGPDPESKKDMATCAVGQNTALRETVGTATYRVTFKDGAYDEIECVKPKAIK